MLRLFNYLNQLADSWRKTEKPCCKGSCNTQTAPTTTTAVTAPVGTETKPKMPRANRLAVDPLLPHPDWDTLALYESTFTEDFTFERSRQIRTVIDTCLKEQAQRPKPPISKWSRTHIEHELLSVLRDIAVERGMGPPEFSLEDRSSSRMVYLAIQSCEQEVRNRLIPKMAYNLWEADQINNTDSEKNWVEAEKTLNDILRDWKYSYNSLFDVLNVELVDRPAPKFTMV